MNNRLLIVVAVIVVILATWFYNTQGETQAPIQIAKPDIEYEATDITATQTDDAGNTEYEVTAQKIERNKQTNQDEMIGIVMKWKPSKDYYYQLTAQRAVLNQETGNIVLSGKVDVTQILDTSDKFMNHDIDDNTDIMMKISAEQIHGNTKQKELYSDYPVVVEQGDNTFEAKNMRGNLQTGDYEFGQIEAIFMPESQ